MNRATRITVSTIGTILGVSGISHGLFEVLQGNTATGGFFISAIGEAHRMWPHGNEYAFTLIPNYLVTGIAAISVGVAAIIWSLWFVGTRRGAIGFLLLFCLLLLLGGGVAQVLLFVPAFLVATRINAPLSLSRRALAGRFGRAFSSLWPWLLGVSAALLLFTLWVAVTGSVPGVSDPDRALTVMIGSLATHVVLVLLTYLAGFARDVQQVS